MICHQNEQMIKHEEIHGIRTVVHKLDIQKANFVIRNDLVFPFSCKTMIERHIELRKQATYTLFY